jgi:hypothetical protein
MIIQLHIFKVCILDQRYFGKEFWSTHFSPSIVFFLDLLTLNPDNYFFFESLPILGLLSNFFRGFLNTTSNQDLKTKRFECTFEVLEQCGVFGLLVFEYEWYHHRDDLFDKNKNHLNQVSVGILVFFSKRTRETLSSKLS